MKIRAELHLEEVIWWWCDKIKDIEIEIYYWQKVRLNPIVFKLFDAMHNANILFYILSTLLFLCG